MTKVTVLRAEEVWRPCPSTNLPNQSPSLAWSQRMPFQFWGFLPTEVQAESLREDALWYSLPQNTGAEHRRLPACSRLISSPSDPHSLKAPGALGLLRGKWQGTGGRCINQPTLRYPQARQLLAAWFPISKSRFVLQFLSILGQVNNPTNT